MKFEMFIPTSNPWTGGAMQIVFAGTDKTTFGAGGVDAYGNAIHVQDNAYLNDKCRAPCIVLGRPPAVMTQVTNGLPFLSLWQPRLSTATTVRSVAVK